MPVRTTCNLETATDIRAPEDDVGPQISAAPRLGRPPARSVETVTMSPVDTLEGKVDTLDAKVDTVLELLRAGPASSS